MKVGLRSIVFVTLCVTTGCRLPFVSSADGEVYSVSGWNPALYPFDFYNEASKTRIIGGYAIRRPCCASMLPGRVDCFILDPDSTLRHQIINGDKRDTWETYPYTYGMVESFTCISSDQGRIYIIYVDQTGVLHTGWYTEGEFKEIKHSGVYMEAPSCTVRRPGVIDCLMRNIYNQLYHIVNQKGNWSKPAPVKSKILKYLPACCPTSEKSLLCLGSSYQNSLDFGTYDEEDGWSDWDAFDEIWIKGKPSMTKFGSRMMGIVHGQANDYIGFVIGHSKAESLTGHFTSDPECLASPNGQTVHCFGVGLESHLYHNSFANDSWDGLQDLGGAYIETPSCTFYDDEKIACYLRGFGKDIIEVTHDV